MAKIPNYTDWDFSKMGRQTNKDYLAKLPVNDCGAVFIRNNVALEFWWWNPISGIETYMGDAVAQYGWTPGSIAMWGNKFYQLMYGPMVVDNTDPLYLNSTTGTMNVLEYDIVPGSSITYTGNSIQIDISSLFLPGYAINIPESTGASMVNSNELLFSLRHEDPSLIKVASLNVADLTTGLCYQIGTYPGVHFDDSVYIPSSNQILIRVNAFPFGGTSLPLGGGPDIPSLPWFPPFNDLDGSWTNCHFGTNPTPTGQCDYLGASYQALIDFSSGNVLDVVEHYGSLSQFIYDDNVLRVNSGQMIFSSTYGDPNYIYNPNFTSYMASSAINQIDQINISGGTISSVTPNAYPSFGGAWTSMGVNVLDAASDPNCIPPLAGCMDPSALNYDPLATVDCAGQNAPLANTACCLYPCHKDI